MAESSAGTRAGDGSRGASDARHLEYAIRHAPSVSAPTPRSRRYKLQLRNLSLKLVRIDRLRGVLLA
jgi:hypothetical protein